MEPDWNAALEAHSRFFDSFLYFLNLPQIMLYDDCEKLLICRIAKNDDVVKSGETLEFNSYLVDIGDLEGDHKNIPNANLPERDKKITDEAGLVRGRKFKHNSVPVGIPLILL